MTVFRLPIGELSDFAYPPTPLGGRQKVRRLQPEEKYPLDGPTEKIRQVVISRTLILCTRAVPRLVLNNHIV